MENDVYFTFSDILFEFSVTCFGSLAGGSLLNAQKRPGEYICYRTSGFYQILGQNQSLHVTRGLRFADGNCQLEIHSILIKVAVTNV